QPVAIRELVIDANVKLVLVERLVSGSRKVVCKPARCRVWKPAQKLSGNRVECSNRDQVAGVGALVARPKDLTDSSLYRVSTGVDYVYRRVSGCNGGDSPVGGTK